MVTKTLKEFELLLKESGFFRVHQSHLVNLQHIKEFIKQDGGYLIMQDGVRIPVSFRKKTEVLKILSNI
jgi:two-component system LytT family response regulator